MSIIPYIFITAKSQKLFTLHLSFVNAYKQGIWRGEEFLFTLHPLFTGMWLGACRLFLFYIAKVIKIFNIIVVLNKNYIFFDMEE
jgi:hypothetical protein